MSAPAAGAHDASMDRLAYSLARLLLSAWQAREAKDIPSPVPQPQPTAEAPA